MSQRPKNLLRFRVLVQAPERGLRFRTTQAQYAQFSAAFTVAAYEIEIYTVMRPKSSFVSFKLYTTPRHYLHERGDGSKAYSTGWVYVVKNQESR